MKFTQGWVKNPNTNQEIDVIVKSILPVKVKDLIVGVSLVSLGVAYITVAAFKHGSICHEHAEFEALKSIDVIK